MRDRLNAVLDGRYSAERELGRGGMASVWLARDLRHQRPVAIKVLHPDLAGAIGVDRFLREIQLTAGLQHPYIIPVLDSGLLPDPGGVALPWYAMAYVPGESLRDRLERERHLPIDDALRITEEAATALHAAHREGIVHRDIKPENLLLAGGHVFIADFGIAKALADTGGERLTATGLAIGTPAYMSPEQASAEAVDARSDQYSLASVLYEMLAGEPPFTGPTATAILARRLTERPRPIRTVRPGVPAAVEAAVLRALERIPADRFPDVAAFAAALRGPEPRGSGRAGPSRWSRGRLAVTGIALLAAVAGGVWLRFGPAPGGGRRAASPDVVALTQRGIRGYDRRTAPGVAEAIAAFGAAIRRDSTYAPGWNGLAKSYVRAYERGFPVPGVPPDSLLRLALAAVERALAADSGSADVWLTQALLSRNIDPTDDGPVLRSLRRALALDSTDAPAWQFFALALAETGDFQGAMAAWRRCVAADPAYTQGLAFLALGHYWRRQYDSARVWADSAVSVDANYLLGWNTAGFIAVERRDYDRGIAAFEAARRLTSDAEASNAVAGVALAQARAGRGSEARATLRDAEPQARAYVPTPLHTALFFAQAYAELGDADRAVAWLARYRPRESLHYQLHLRCDPPFDPIARDPRFRSLLTPPARGRGGSC